MSRRAAIRMDPREIEDYLAGRRVVQVATVGPRGRPHLAPLWFVPRPFADGMPVLATWTYAKSQKATNLRRLPQATALVESGDTYTRLRGVSMECDVTILDDDEATRHIGLELIDRYGAAYESDREPLVAEFAKQARKRVGLLLTATRIVSWDHSKLGVP